MTGFAFDRETTRRVDANGHLHVGVSNITKATVNPYYGREIPDYQNLGLDPDRIYYLYRDPEELRKAVDTFNNLPILSEHVPVSADAPAKELTVGSTGTDAVFIDPYLQNSTVYWVKSAIDGIEQGTARELSSAYRYRADMTPGEILGLRYDGVMRDIAGNHLALVDRGRAGPDVVVGDQAMKFRDRLRASASKAAAQIKLAQDAGIDTSEIDRLVSLAQDGDMNDADRDDDDDGKPPVAEDDDDDDDDGKDKVAEDDDDDDDDDKDKPAMDAATIARTAREEARREMHAVRAAERAVAPFIGEVVAMDSAAAIYCLALDHAKVKYPKGQTADVYAAMVAMLPKPSGDTPAVAMDHAGAQSSFVARFPGSERLLAGSR